MWELYNSGNALQLGYNHGALAENLLHHQEQIFFSNVEKLVPSKGKQKLLNSFLRWYTRKMQDYVRTDFQAEIYGISHYSSDEFDVVAPRFSRSLSLHAAHDIGHAMQDLMLVGCSSLAVWDDHSADGSLLLGRVFDFYAGEGFSDNKLIQFVKPEDGHAFMSVSWPGMAGVASGMNVKGLAVTINAGKSKIPWSAKTPISLVTREILQFAENIDEAIAIAKKRKVFVSESIMVGSAKDHRAIIIEVSPKNFGVYEAPNSGKLVCTNHFQSENYKHGRRNLEQKANSHSMYRFDKINDFVDEYPKLDPESMVKILRERHGINDLQIGNGNEKSVNQLLAHHAVVFSPEKNLVWVSSPPYQLGEFVCYDLNKIFAETPLPGNLETASLNISADPFLFTQEYRNFESYKKADRQIDFAKKEHKILDDSWLLNYKKLNPNLWIVHFKSGKYHYQQKNYAEAILDFKQALSCEISTVEERNIIEKYLGKALRKIPKK